jgi:hypothetical protein
MERQSTSARAHQFVGSDAWKGWVYYDYGTHEKATQHFVERGLDMIKVVPGFLSSDVKRIMEERLQPLEPLVRVVDLTSKMPTTASGNLFDTIALLSKCRAAAHSNPNILWYVQRTQENTPAFVHLFAYGNQLSTIKEPFDYTAVPKALSDATYGGLVMFRSKEVTLPARLCVGDASLAANVLLSNSSVNYHGLKCVECKKPFTRWAVIGDRSVRCLDDMLLTDCNHVMHPRCMMSRVASGCPNATLCPECGEQLPISTYDGPKDLCDLVAGCGTSSHYIGNCEQHRAAVEAAGRASVADALRASFRAQFNATALQGAGATVDMADLGPV